MSAAAERSHLRLVDPIPGPEIEEGKRQMLAIMFSDIKGYSSMMGKDEDLAFELLEDHNAVVVPRIENHQGKVLKFIGDAVLASFESAIQASQCALDIQTEFARFNESRPKNKKVWIRIGIHVGDVLVKNNDVFGDGVNVASRLEPLSEPGGIVISATVRDVIQANAVFNLEPMGSLSLKNIQYPVQGYRILTPSSGNLILRRLRRKVNSFFGFFGALGSFLVKGIKIMAVLALILVIIGIIKKKRKAPEPVSKTVKSSKTVSVAKIEDSTQPGSTDGSLTIQTSPPEKRFIKSSSNAYLPVTLKLNHVPASLVFNAICKAAKAECLLDESVSGSLSVDYKGATIQEIFEDLRVLNRFDIQETKSGRFIIQGAKE